MDEKFHISYATDVGYLVPTLVAASSALSWAGAQRGGIVIHILDVSIPDERWQWFERRLRCLFGESFGLVRHPIEESAFHGFRRWHGSVAAYARLLLPDLLPEVGWCFYGDGDTLFTGNPLLLREYFDDRYALIGHQDNDSRVQAVWFEKHGYHFDFDEYVCSGFLLMNLEAFREGMLGEKCLELISRHPDLTCPDQDALNIICHGRIRQLRNKWGAFGYLYGSISEPGCIHYGSRQPWKLIYMSHRGIMDIEQLWFEFATKVCGLTAADFGPKYGRLRHAYLKCVSILFKLILVLCGNIPRVKGRLMVLKAQFISHLQIRNFLKCAS